MAAPEGPSPAVPQGWQVTWSDPQSQWFYTNQATGASQWEPPSIPTYSGAPVATPQSSYYNPTQPQYAQQGFAPTAAATQPEAARGSTGIMGKLSSLDPKAQAALAVGGGLAAGAFLEHEISEYSGGPSYSHHGNHHHILGSMASLIGSAGAGALGARFFGRKTQAAQPAPPPPGPQYYPTSPPGQPAYPGQYAPQGDPNSGSGFGGLGKYAVGGAAGVAGALAMNGASNLLHHHQDQGAAPPALGGSGGMGSFLGGLTHSGPRLTIHAATFADKDVTDQARSMVTPEQVLAINNLTDEFGDPWPEVKKKMFSVLYQYGDRPMEVWVGCTVDGKIEIRHEALANARMAYVNKDPGRITCLIWGRSSVLSKERVEKLETDGEMDCSGLGDGEFYPWDPRNLICYYRAPNGGFGIGHAREGGTLRLPWNPLAKWS